MLSQLIIHGGPQKRGSLLLMVTRRVSTHLNNCLAVSTTNEFITLIVMLLLLLHVQILSRLVFSTALAAYCSAVVLYVQALYLLSTVLRASARGGSRKKYLGGLAPHHLGGNNG